MNQRVELRISMMVPDMIGAAGYLGLISGYAWVDGWVQDS